MSDVGEPSYTYGHEPLQRKFYSLLWRREGKNKRRGKNSYIDRGDTHGLRLHFVDFDIFTCVCQLYSVNPTELARQF